MLQPVSWTLVKRKWKKQRAFFTGASPEFKWKKQRVWTQDYIIKCTKLNPQPYLQLSLSPNLRPSPSLSTDGPTSNQTSLSSSLIKPGIYNIF